MTEKQIRTE